MTILIELRTTAMRVRNTLLAFQLRECANELGPALEAFNIAACEDTLRPVVNLFARARRLLALADDEPINDGPGGGRIRDVA